MQEEDRNAEHGPGYPGSQEQCQTKAWEPKQAMSVRGIGWAIKNMYHGIKVRRRGWNGRSMWLAMQIPDANSKMTLPYIYMRTAQGDLVPWLCSQTDLLAVDWEAATVSEF